MFPVPKQARPPLPSADEFRRQWRERAAEQLSRAYAAIPDTLSKHFPLIQRPTRNNAGNRSMEARLLEIGKWPTPRVVAIVVCEVYCLSHVDCLYRAQAWTNFPWSQDGVAK